MVCIDILHALDLGVTQDAIGNTLWEFIQSPALPGSKRQATMKNRNVKLKQHDKARKRGAIPVALSNVAW